MLRRNILSLAVLSNHGGDLVGLKVEADDVWKGVLGSMILTLLCIRNVLSKQLPSHLTVSLSST